MLLQLRYARQMEKAGKLKVVSAIVRAICMRGADALPHTDHLRGAGARLHAFRPRSSQRPCDLAVYGRAAVLQASGTGLGLRGLTRCCMQRCALDEFGLIYPFCSLYSKSDVQETAQELLHVLPKSAGTTSGGGSAAVGL